MRNTMICLVRRHAWAGWHGQELDMPGTLARTCSRCGRVQTNARANDSDIWWRMPNM